MSDIQTMNNIICLFIHIPFIEHIIILTSFSLYFNTVVLYENCSWKLFYCVCATCKKQQQQQQKVEIFDCALTQFYSSDLTF